MASVLRGAALPQEMEFQPRSTACVRSRTPRFARTAETWLLTVPSLRCSPGAGAQRADDRLGEGGEAVAERVVQVARDPQPLGAAAPLRQQGLSGDELGVDVREPSARAQR